VLEISRFSCMLFLSVRGFSDYTGPTVHSRLTWLPCCLPPTRNEVGILIYGLFAAQWPRPPMPLVYASKDTSPCPLQDSRSGWIRYFLSCRALASPTTCRFNPAHSDLPVTRARCREAASNRVPTRSFLCACATLRLGSFGKSSTAPSSRFLCIRLTLTSTLPWD
jgi:hypothetical protein